MIDKLNEQALLQANQRAFRVAIIRKINQIADAINVGVVHDNKVTADRNVEQIYTDLPLSVTAEMVEEEYNDVMSELGLNETEVL